MRRIDTEERDAGDGTGFIYHVLQWMYERIAAHGAELDGLRIGMLCTLALGTAGFILSLIALWRQV